MNNIFLNLEKREKRKAEAVLDAVTAASQGQTWKNLDSLLLEVADHAFHQVNLMQSEWFSSFKYMERASGYS